MRRAAEEAGVQRRPPRATRAPTARCAGRLLALLRDAEDAVDAAVLDDAWPDEVQRERALASLLDDGLVVAVSGGYALPA